MSGRGTPNTPSKQQQQQQQQPLPPARAFAKVDLDDGLGELNYEAEKLGESGGTIRMSATSAHPFMSQSTILKFGLALYAFIALLGPVHIYQYRDPESAHQDMFNFSFLLFLMLTLQFHRTRLEEWWICVRAFKQRAGSHLGGRLPAAFACLVAAFSMQMLLSEYEEASGRLDFTYIVSSATMTGVLMLLAIVFVWRQERCFVIDDRTSITH